MLETRKMCMQRRRVRRDEVLKKMDTSALNIWTVIERLARTIKKDAARSYRRCRERCAVEDS